MRFIRTPLFILIISVLFCGDAFSQVAISDTRFKKRTLFYYIHTIKKNETLGAIAVAYKVPLNDILKVNTISNPEKITENQKVMIPDYSRFIDKYPNDQWTFELYNVKQGEKLKNIAKNFKIDTDDVKNLNPGIDSKPEAGFDILIPIPKQNQQVAEKKPEKKNEDKDDKKDSKKNPALSFNWGNDNNDKKEDKPEKDNKNSKDCRKYVYKTGTFFNISIVAPLKNSEGLNDYNGISFLQGALLAVDEMKEGGLSVKLNIYDAGAKNSLSKIIDSKELKESHLIIAPVQLSDLDKLARYAQDKEIPLVVPHESKAYTLLSENPYFIQVYPSDEAIYNKLTSKQYNRSEIRPILIKPATPDSVMLKNYRNALTKRYGTFEEHTHVMGLRMTNLNLKDVLDKDKHNVVFVCSNTEPFVSDLLDRLKVLKCPLSVYGRDKWREFRMIDRALYFDVNLHLVQPCFVDYNDDRVKQFVQLYRMAYDNEPGGYAFQGYDILYYFMATLKKYGPSFSGCFTEFNSTLLQSQYKFKQNHVNDGFVNDGCFLLEYTPDIEIKRE